jgi:RNA polymerase sigma-70 factor (ECF subfamily)
MTNTLEQMNTELTVAHRDFEKKLFTHAYFKVNDKATSEDLVQNTFMKTWNYIVKGGEIKMMRAFLYHILNDLIVDEYRKRKSLSLDVLLESGYEPSAKDSMKFVDEIDSRSALSMIAQLPMKYREVMFMRFERMLTLTEISLITGMSKNTTAVQIHRGTEKLKELYNPKMA